MSASRRRRRRRRRSQTRPFWDDPGGPTRKWSLRRLPLVARYAAAVFVVGLLAGVGMVVLHMPGLYVAFEGAFVAFALGFVLWVFGERNLGEIGQAVMVTVALAAVLGIPQYLLDQDQKARAKKAEAAEKERDRRAEARQKERDFKQSLSLADTLAGANLANAHLSDVRLRGKSLRDADLRGAELRNARLDHTDLHGANLAGADLRGADLRVADLSDAWLAGADLRGANLDNADLPGATLRGAKVDGANLEITSFKFSCLAGASLRNARVAGADFFGAVLTGADLRGALLESDLKPARIGLTGLKGVKYDRRTAWPLDFKRISAAVRGVPRNDSLPLTRPARNPIRARVVDVPDGDTVQVEVDRADRDRLHPPGRTRLLGVDAPDMGPRDGPGEVARDVLRGRLLGKRVRIQLAAARNDTHSRYLVYMWLGRRRMKTVNQELLERGVVTLKTRDDKAWQRGENAEWVTALERAELRARQRGVGLWERCPEPQFGVD